MGDSVRPFARALQVERHRLAIHLWPEGIDIVLCLEEHRRKSLADHMKKLKQRHLGALHRAQNPCQMRDIDLLFCKPVFDPWTIGVIIPTVISDHLPPPEVLCADRRGSSSAQDLPKSSAQAPLHSTSSPQVFLLDSRSSVVNGLALASSATDSTSRKLINCPQALETSRTSSLPGQPSCSQKQLL